MNEHIDDLLPFYSNHTLSAEALIEVEAHLAACPSCRARLAEWDKLSITVNQGVSIRLPGTWAQAGVPQRPLSPLVSANLKRRPPLRQAILSAANLVWAQRIFLARGWLVPSLVSIILLGAAASFVFQGLAPGWVVFPLFAAIPIAAALSTAFLTTFEDDPTCEIISAAPTAPGTLIFARLTLALGAISLLAFTLSLLLAFFGQSTHSLFDLVAAWLGPMLLLSALTTLLTLCLHPQAAAGTALALWGGIVIVLLSERAGAPVLKLSIIWLLHPTWALLAGQVLLAGLLWLGCWLWLEGSMPTLRRSTRGS